MLADGCIVSGVSFISGAPPDDANVSVKIRYRTPAIAAILEPIGERWAVRFGERQPAPAPGQAAVFYEGDRVLGGGTIEEVIRA